ncbi:hypothetical protein DSM3645_02568 [Blastopirellula marina DSM 3645]|uniref:Uncharacterized protein n=1 Tax=Blastopirellula marina DSM 3645 TaxID=314230 RepID=A3ZVH7_9BACT|nr:hypothetical protein DSM3645_02568 [Blastopirellula marina DSM 3645]
MGSLGNVPSSQLRMRNTLAR